MQTNTATLESTTNPRDRSARARTAADLVYRIRAGERRAEDELVARYSKTVHVLLSRMTGAAAQADDLHQDTFRLVLKKVRAGELRDPSKLPGFINHLARNLFIADYRKRVRRPRSDDLEAAARAGGLIDSAPSPLAAILQREEGRRVRQLLSRLRPERDREILYRYFIAEDAKEEICAEMGLSSLRFNHVLHRARRRFRALITQHEAEQPASAGRGLGLERRVYGGQSSVAVN